MIEFLDTQIGYSSGLFNIPKLFLEKGKIYALIGANGSGKSTFLKTIIKDHHVFKGVIKIDRVPIEKYIRKELAKKIAFVESRFDGVDFLKVKEYVALGRSPYTSFLGKLSDTDLQIVERSLDLLNLKSFEDKFTNQLSDGEKQLAAISRALAQDTETIILDEPTAFLDYGNRQKLISLLQKIAIEENKCILFSSHDLDLCIEKKIDILVIDQKDKTLKHFVESPSKSEILEIGFSV